MLPAGSRTTSGSAELHVCPTCARPFVVPSEVLAILPADQGYVVELSCNNWGASRIDACGEAGMAHGHVLPEDF